MYLPLYALALILCERLHFYYLLMTAERIAVYTVFEISNSSIAPSWISVNQTSKCGSGGDQRILVFCQDNKGVTV